MLVIAFITACIATFLSSMSGGGSSVIVIPVLLGLGVPFPLATATQKVSAVFWVVPAAYNYLKNRKVDWGFLFSFAIVGLIGTYLGVQFVLSIDQKILKIVIGVIIILLVIYTYFKRDLGLQEHQVSSKFRKFLSYPIAIILGFYESMFGSGNGIAFSLTSFYTRGFDFINALGYYFAIAFFWVLFAAILFIQKGFYDMSLMITVTIGSVIGGYFGSKYARYKGNYFIKLAFVIVGGVLGLKLILGL